ncbi:HAMP domain-containing sensor histidine kinase [Nocardioides sp. InS609-2]|uniref:sensor histidine kinase n=1 Tax=Nocardioides sp. InS609-2 TaxID=2760705 RepID=UPI0020BFE0E5|nr:HAMP domain-containing sensor histidine kinase [Nocardioides sp. InS609-2]
MRDRFASLTARLVLTAVLLVVVVSALIGVAATLAMQNRLTAQVDDQLNETLRRPTFFGPGAGNTEPGTVIAQFRDGQEGEGLRFGRGPDNDRPLSSTVLDELASVSPSDGTTSVDLTALGSYRVKAIDGAAGTLVVGLPDGDVGEAVSSLIGYEVLFIALGSLVAAGGALVVVRRQLAPLREVAATAHNVAALPLATGAIELSERVPGNLTDVRTEVGQVGAALNTLLSHVESSLESRHRSEQQVRQFVADASHELRTPLATIQGYAELAPRHPAQTEVALAKVEGETLRMTSLVEDLLLLARLDAGRPLASAPVDVTRLLVEAVSDARVLAPDHQWRLDLPSEAVEVAGDEQRLHQVVMNLMTNARKYTPAGTTVTVRARPGLIAVHDDGPGFAPELVEEAFERFARADAARTRGPDRGAGLGLALVKAIVEAHAGTVALDSRPGDTTVTVTLPA